MDAGLVPDYTVRVRTCRSSFLAVVVAGVLAVTIAPAHASEQGARARREPVRTADYIGLVYLDLLVREVDEPGLTTGETSCSVPEVIAWCSPAP
ncbi:MAG: hypothetical protein H0U26_04715 [Acidimicrobiia bacterium]|nr:hypothetical protein [Acidimicrobiia bacterium]